MRDLSDFRGFEADEHEQSHDSRDFNSQLNSDTDEINSDSEGPNHSQETNNVKNDDSNLKFKALQVSSSQHEVVIVRVYILESQSLPFGYFSLIEIRNMINANCITPNAVVDMPLIESLIRGGCAVGDCVIIITSSDGTRRQSVSVFEKQFFNGSFRWQHWKQFYLDFIAHSSSNQMMPAGSSNEKNFQLHLLRKRILINPKTMEPYKSPEMKEVVNYLKVEYKVREFCGDTALKGYVRFLLESFSLEIRKRLEIGGYHINH